MILLPAVRSLLLANGTVSGLIGSRLYPLRRPQGSALPAMTYQVVAGDRDHAHGGMTALANRWVQFTAWADTDAASAYSQVQTLADLVETVLGGYRGTTGGVEIGGAFVRGRRDFDEDGPDGIQRVFGASVDIEFFYQET